MQIKQDIVMADVLDGLNQPTVIGRRPDPPARGRLSVVEMVYYQAPGEDAKSIDSRFSRWTESTEEPFSRGFMVGEEWTALPKGWLESVSMLVIKNQITKHRVMPTEEEKLMASSKVVEVSFRADDTADALILPGESLRLSPNRLESIRVRCRNGQTKCQMTATPR